MMIQGLAKHTVLDALLLVWMQKKAFDLVNQQFLYKTLLKFQFQESDIKTIQIL